MSTPILFTCTFQEPQAWGMAGSDWPQKMAKEYSETGDREFTLVDDPEVAEIIVFWEPYQASQERWAPRLRAHPLVKKYPEKVFAVSPEDKPLGFLRGLYCSLSKRLFDPARHRTWVYQGTLNPYIEEMAASSSGTTPKKLAAFIGGPSHPVREKLFRNAETLATHGIFIGRTQPSLFNVDPSHPSLKEQQLRYIEAILESKFSLCPRGNGPGSFRMQESMSLGRAPIILGDEWVPVKGPDWERCAIILPENQVLKLPQILKARENNWQEMGRAARAEWEKYFQPRNYALKAMQQLKELHAQGGSREAALQKSWDDLMGKEIRRENPLVQRLLRKFKRRQSS